MEYFLDELFDLQMGKTPARNNLKYWNSQDHKWISISDLSKCGKYISETKEFLSEKAIQESGITLIPANTVVMSFKLSIGKTAITTEPMYSNEAIMSFRDKNVIDLIPDYIYYLFSGKDWDAGTNKAVMGKTLNKAILSKIKIKVHCFSEQEKIVKILDEVVHVINKRKQQLRQLDELVKARFVEMFGDPTDIRLSRVPLIEYVENTKYGTSQPPQFDENGCFKFIRATNIKSGHINEKDMLFISKEESEKIGKCKLNGGEIIIVRSGANTGDTCVITDEYKGQYAGYDIIVTLKTDKLNPVFLNELINIPRYMKTVVKPLTARSAQPHLNTQQVQSLPILVVDIDKQKEFAVFVEQIDKSKFYIQMNLMKCKEFKKLNVGIFWVR